MGSKPHRIMDRRGFVMNPAVVTPPPSNRPIGWLAAVVSTFSFSIAAPIATLIIATGLDPTHLLVVRDLASGNVLLATPAPGESASLVVTVLASLFRWFGAPLVLKLDNGGPFITDEIKDLLRRHGVLPLYSPPGLPRYNGAVEAYNIKIQSFPGMLVASPFGFPPAEFFAADPKNP